MWIRLRQIAVVAADLHKTALDVGAVLGVEACFTDPYIAQFGLKNTLWPIGTQFLEVVTPTEPDTAAGRYHARRGGDTGYMVITQVDDIAARRRRIAELGIRIAFDLHMPEQGHDGMQLHPADTGGPLLEMDQMLGEGGDAVGGPWYPAGEGWRPFVRNDHVSAITAAELQSPDPSRLASRWSEIIEIEATTDANGAASIELDNASLRFVEATDGQGEGLGGIDVATQDRDAILEAARQRNCYVNDDEVLIAGVRINLVQSP